ncbi:MAG: efflux RND transporter periplasmic adaptor subunit [Caulobacterales bacterium]
MSESKGRVTLFIAVFGIIAALGVAIAGREFLNADDARGAGAGAPPAAASMSKSGKAGEGAGGGRPPGGGGAGGTPAPVTVAVVAEQTFSDAIEALGTAQAYESVTITSSVTDVIRALRFDSGDRVQRGQVLVELDAGEESGALGEALAAQAEAEQDRVRFEDLHARGFAPDARLEEARAAVGRAEARVQSARARVADRVIRAPFTGVIGLRSASVGALVRPGDVIATLDDLGRIKLDFDVSETFLARLRPGVAVVARTTAYPNALFEGVIDTVDSRVNQTTRNVRVRAIIDNTDRMLRGGMLLTVEVRANPRQALAVPEIALLDQAAGPAVYQLIERDGASVAQLTPIQAGQRVAGMVEVLDGLGAGDRIVAEGVSRVRPGQPVRVRGNEPAPPEEAPVSPSVPSRS